MKTPPYKIAIALSVALAHFSGAAIAEEPRALKNMERERASMIEALTSAELSPSERTTRVNTSKRRLIDLERMVLRDDSVIANPTPAVRQALNHYDLTFLVHASAEKKRHVLDHWLDEMGISTSAILNARKGRR